MIPIAGKPVLEYEIESLVRSGITEIIIVVGHLGSVIVDYFSDGSQLGATISYYSEDTPLGTAGALYYLKDKLTEPFFLLNGDIMLDIDFIRMMRYHRDKNATVTLFTHPNSHPFDSALIFTDSLGRVTKWLHKEDERSIYKNRVNAGIHILSPDILNLFDGAFVDLDRDILKPLVSYGHVYAYDSPEYVKDMGTPERLKRVEEDVLAGKVRGRNLKNRQKAIFLDRDGTLNKYKGFITKPQDIELIDGVAEAIRRVNDSDYLTIVVTNQPVIARGECTIDELNDINATLETELGKHGAYIDGLFYCPHHPDRGFEGERPEYKVECDCRKPKPGLLFKAAEIFNIDLTASYMVGDSMTDVMAGMNAGCQAILIDNAMESTKENESYESLLEFVREIIPS